MKTVKYTPEACRESKDKDGKVVPPTFSGEVELRLPTFDEKYEYFEQTGVQIDDAGAVVMGNTIEKIKMLRKLVKISEPHYVSVSLKHLQSKDEIKSFSDMSVDDRCHPILIEIAGKLLNGFKLEK